MYNLGMEDKFAQRAAEIIKEILYITIASVSADGKPWNSPVYSAYDGDLNFYWFSDKDSQHSTNLRTNNEAFLVIYNSTVPQGTGEGVYIQAKVRELTDETEIMAARALMDKRVGKVKPRQFSDYTGEAPLRGYQASAVKVWMNDLALDAQGNYIKDVRVEISLSDLKNQL
jgi:general stress protein 26